MNRCGKCDNCIELERIRKRVLGCINPPFSHADNGVVTLWNKELERLPCWREIHKRKKQEKSKETERI